MMQQTIHGGGRDEVVEEQRVPLFEGSVGGDDHRAALISLTDDLVEIDGLVAFQRPEPEIVNDEQIRRGEPQDLLVVAPVGPGGSQLAEHLVRRDVAGRIADPACPLADGLGKMRLATSSSDRGGRATLSP